MRHLPIHFIVVLALAPAAAAQTTRDWRVWPFSERSPWNHPIGSAAQYASVSHLAALPVTINPDDRWTSSVVIAQPEHPEVTLLFGPSWGQHSQWEFLRHGGKNCNNAPAVEQALVQYASPDVPYTANYYSTTSTPNDSKWVLPADYHPANSDYRGRFRLPPGACPSADSDGFMAVFQPDGWVVDIFATIVTADRHVLGTMASYIDARGDGTGWWNGRRASMLPSFAGLIRTGEIASGRIPHALAVHVPRTLLKEQAVWPAYAFDRNSGYSGTLPMGALLAIPPQVRIDELDLSPRGLVIARAAQDYGVYVVDRGGTGVSFLAELGNPDIRWPRSGEGAADWQDLQTIKSHLRRVINNGPQSIGGGGTPRAPFAPPFHAELPPAPILLP